MPQEVQGLGRGKKRVASSSNTNDPGLADNKRARRDSPNDLVKECRTCATCIEMFSREGLRDLNTPEGFQHKTRSECIVSGSQGCKMCKCIFSLVFKDYQNDMPMDDPLVIRNDLDFDVINSHHTGQLPSISRLTCSFRSEPEKHAIKIYPFARKGSPFGELVRRRPLSRDMKSKAVFSAVDSHLKSCMGPERPHRHCQYFQNSVLPRRVIDVGKDGDEAVRLKINETDSYAAYVALSYCWGAQTRPNSVAHPLQLIRDTVQYMVRQIEIKKLQQCIQDAVYVTRKLRFRYLWVDALCIIQDCPIDKDQEVSNMASIYKNATITIAASSSKSAADGFLGRLSQPYCPGYEVEIPMENGKLGTVYLTAGAYEPEHPLDERGWTLQEFMLSPRILLFSEYEVLWQCKELDLRGVTGTGLEYLQSLETLPWAVFDEDAQPDFGHLEFDKIYLWKTIVQQYTERKLSDPEDRLRAIMGIVIELETLWHDVNLYGLWSKWFIELLAWYKPSVHREEKRWVERAPSWSWASLNGLVQYEGLMTAQDAQAVSLTTSSIELTCCVLEGGGVPEEKAHSISERPDLIDPIAEIQEVGLRHKEADYVLLGTTQSGDGSERGVGLLVLDVGSHVYRRIGLAVFSDMSIWEDVERQRILMEPSV